jgi:hypothetical protein
MNKKKVSTHEVNIIISPIRSLNTRYHCTTSGCP